MAGFTEIQQNRYRWYLVDFAILFPALVFWQFDIVETIQEIWVPFLVIGSYSLCSTGFLYFTMFRKISTEIDKGSIRYCIKPFGRWQTIQWTDIERIYVREFALYGEYPIGFLGIRQGPHGKKSGGKILPGTQRPHKIQFFLATHTTLTTT